MPYTSDNLGSITLYVYKHFGWEEHKIREEFQCIKLIVICLCWIFIAQYLQFDPLYKNSNALKASSVYKEHIRKIKKDIDKGA